MNTLSFMLEIYAPDSEDECLCSFSANTAFPKISEGELLNLFDIPAKLRVKKIMHLIWQNEDRVSIKTMLYTEEISS